HPNNQYINTWWPYRDQAANVYTFTGQYLIVNDLQNGKGYWMKHQNDRIYNTGDEWPSGGILYVPNVPIQCNTGWNLIGPYQSSVSVSSISTTPSNIISSFFYGYTPGSGFQNVSVLNPGQGYWVKLNNSGKINLTSSNLNSFVSKDFNTDEDWIKITLTDAANKTYTLYLINNNESTEFYELPPVPFPEIFDVRFASGKFVESGFDEKSIQFQGVTYPLIIKIQNGKLKVRLDNGYENYLSEDNQLIIENELINKIFIQQELIANEFRLNQNYPNPFNPSTKISWQSPVTSWQTLRVYDVLGNEVAILVNEEKPAGVYEIIFDASGLSSGIYFYKLSVGSFTEIKKMILTK
ncbi:MAG: T9SS type A sorting domain-containing protein, partial [Ignavibacterium sp.]